MTKQIELELSVVLLLDEMVSSLITKVTKNDDGTYVVEERDLPFKLKYSLSRNKAILDKFAEQFNERKSIIVAKYADSDTKDKIYIKNEESLEKFKAEVSEILNTKVSISVLKLLPEELLSITDTIDFSDDALKVLMAYLVEDNDYFNDFVTALEINPFNKEVVEVAKKEGEPIVENVSPVKKTTKKTSTTKKSTTTKKATSKNKSTK